MAVLTLPRRLRRVTLDAQGPAASPEHSATIIPFVRRAPPRDPVNAAAIRLLDTLISRSIPGTPEHATNLRLREMFDA